ncbi:MAG: glycerophosphodiester phosphodiesterase [Clostridia bacterium]|nr:glycerophosphodiester phosphodiesterase [Clostridia bacterium]
MVIALVVILLVLAFCLFALSGRGGKTRFSGFEGFDIAHRGLHKKPTVPENSMAAFKAAIDKGYGIELDLHLLRDGGIAVFHDNTLDRTTGKQGNIKDLTLEDLKNYTLEESSETIPNFPEVLKLVDGKVPLIIELKVENNTAALCKATLDALKDYKGEYCIESFDPRPLIWLRKNSPEITRGQLSQNFLKAKSSLSMPIRVLLTTLFMNIATKPDFIAFKFNDRKLIFNQISTKLFGLQPVCWTIKSIEDHKQAKSEGYISIFEQFEP